MWPVIFLTIFAYECVSSEAELPLNMEACSIGDSVENECTKCTCTTRNVYECKPKTCQRSFQDGNFNRAHGRGMSCQPHKIYHQLSTICICRADGSWPHDSCHFTFRLLPAANIVKRKCTGNKYAIIDCNICMCNAKGQIENERCTQNECDEDDTKDDHRRKEKSSQVFGNCKAQNWYSLAPCQFCYCLNNNKLMCNTGTNNVKGIRLGSYNFSLCGPDFLKEALELIPDGQKTANIMRMSEDAQPSPTTEETTAKPRKPKSFEFQELFEKADLERMQQKENEKNEEHEDYNSDMNEKVSKKTSKKPIGRDGTQQPYDERESDYSDNKDDKAAMNDDGGSSENDENDQTAVKPKIAPVKKGRSEAHENDDTDEGGFDLGAALKQNLPFMLSKVFNVRKTVVLDSKTKCEPESRLTIGCNICHCMKNGKMLCTDKKCD